MSIRVKRRARAKKKKSGRTGAARRGVSTAVGGGGGAVGGHCRESKSLSTFNDPDPGLDTGGMMAIHVTHYTRR